MPKKGVKHHFAKLNPELVAEMREKYIRTGASFLDMSVEYDVGLNTAYQAIVGQTWKSAPHPAVKECTTCHGAGRVLDDGAASGL